MWSMVNVKEAVTMENVDAVNMISVEKSEWWYCFTLMHIKDGARHLKDREADGAKINRQLECPIFRLKLSFNFTVIECSVYELEKMVRLF